MTSRTRKPKSTITDTFTKALPISNFVASTRW